MTKMIGFRASDKALKVIEKFAKDNKLTTSKAVNAIIEKFQSEPQSSSPFSPTGTLLLCPLRKVVVPYERPIIHWKSPVDTSVCKSCSKHPCESWEDWESWKRTEPMTPNQPKGA